MRGRPLPDGAGCFGAVAPVAVTRTVRAGLLAGSRPRDEGEDHRIGGGTGGKAVGEMIECGGGDEPLRSAQGESGPDRRAERHRDERVVADARGRLDRPLPGAARGHHGSGPYLGPQQPPEQRHQPSRPRVAGDLVVDRYQGERLDRLLQQLRRGVVGVAALREIGGAERVLDGERCCRRRRRPGEVMGQRRQIVRTATAYDVRDPGVQARAAHPDQIGVHGVADQGVREPDQAGRRFGEQPGEDALLQAVEHLVLRVAFGIRGLDEHAHLGLAADHRGELEDGQGARLELPQSPAEHVAHALRHLGDRHQGTLAGEQPGALAYVEGVAAGPLGEGGHGGGVDRGAAQGPDHGVHGVRRQAAQSQPVR